MRAVAEGLVLRRPAAAQRHAVAHFVLEAVGADDLDPAAQPYRSQAYIDRVFHESDRGRVRWLQRLAGRVVPSHQPSRGTVAGLTLKMHARRAIVRFVDEVPHRTVGIAEAAGRAQALDIRQRHRRSLHELCLLAVRRTIRGFAAVKSNPLVRVVAERLVRAVAAAAKSVLRLVRMFLPVLPLHRLAGAIGPDNLLAKR